MKKLLAFLISSVMLFTITTAVSADAGDDVSTDVTVTVVRPAWDVVIEPLSFEVVAGNMVTKLPVIKNNMTDAVYVTKIVVTPIDGWTAELGMTEPIINSKKIRASCATAYGSTPTLEGNSIVLTGKGIHQGSKANANSSLDMNVSCTPYDFMAASLAKDSSFPVGGSMKVATMTINIDWA